MIYTKEKIEAIKSSYGLPCYVYDEKAFRDNYCSFEKALCDRYPNYHIAYSYKTNYAPKLCSIVKSLGGYAEVVSDMEYDIAKAIGYENSMIIYNGPFKGPKMEEHLLSEGILNIDNLDEVERVICIAKNKQKMLKVGIRANIDVGQSFISRFGIDADAKDLELAVKKIEECEYTKLVGFHCHIGRSRSVEAWKTRTTKILALADRFIEDIPDYLDLGSGMFGDLAPELREQFTVDIPTYFDYADVTAKIVNDHYALSNKKPILFTEPGTTLDNRYIDLIAEVDSIKKIRGKAIAVLNCSVHNLGDVSGSLKLPLQIISNSAERIHYQDIDMVGYTCLERDVPFKGYTGQLGKGDYLVFGNVGGYSNVDKPPFILPQCAMIGAINNQMYLIKRKETTEDILSTYIMM